MPSIRDYLLWPGSLLQAVAEDVWSLGEAVAEDVLPKYFPPTTKPYYDDGDDGDDEWEELDNFPTETVTSDDTWVLVPRADVELLPMSATCS
jgi:hypothetical protein